MCSFSSSAVAVAGIHTIVVAMAADIRIRLLLDIDLAYLGIDLAYLEVDLAYLGIDLAYLGIDLAYLEVDLEALVFRRRDCPS